MFVVGPGNVCDYSHRSDYAGDHPPLADVMASGTRSNWLLGFMFACGIAGQLACALIG